MRNPAPLPHLWVRVRRKWQLHVVRQDVGAFLVASGLLAFGLCPIASNAPFVRDWFLLMAGALIGGVLSDLLRWGIRSYGQGPTLVALVVMGAVALLVSLGFAVFKKTGSPLYESALFVLSALTGALFGERIPRQPPNSATPKQPDNTGCAEKA